MPGSLLSGFSGLVANLASIRHPAITVARLWEYVSSISPNSTAMSWDDSNATVVWDVPYAYVQDAISRILGYAYCNKGTNAQNPTYIYHVNPVRHPVLTWMHAAKIESITGLGPRGKVATFNPFGVPGIPPYTESYELYRITAQFHNPPYDVLEDNQTNDTTYEAGRYFYQEGLEASANFITLEGGQAIFAAGQGAMSNRPFTAPGRAVAETQHVFKFRWTRVPIEYVEQATGSSTYGHPFKFRQCLQKVNSETFLGFAPYTLLFEPYEYVRKRMPIATVQGGYKWWADILMSLRYFEPKLGSGATSAGHRTAPNQDGLYFHVKRSNGNELYEAVDFAKLFAPPEIALA